MAKDFPTAGLTYFWFLNDECRPEHIDRQIAEFARADVATVCLHPRAGLLLPYGGDDWFDFIRRTVRKCADAGLGVWLYDEDPYPSGSAGGWVTLDEPGFVARAIERFEAPADLAEGDLFCFPAGKLLWAGLVPDDAGTERVDLTSKVGVVRREWRVLSPWDSRWYYPATPLYECDRSETYVPELALKAPRVPGGVKLLAFVARPVGAGVYASPWGVLHDSLNPQVTQRFIERTHERYYETVGEMFGDPITAIFTDEPKYFGGRPWTPGMFEAFATAFGYELAPRLEDLFPGAQALSAMRTRLDYRRWCGERFEQAWLAPVADWCRDHGLRLVGHISPEDDPVEQANMITNLFPLQKHFGLAGLDLIIPAVGDADHPLLNVGITLAASAAQQNRQAGVMSESLGCSGLEFTAQQAGRILGWQTAMGLTTPVVHAAFSSTEGERLLDAPPDFGPMGPRWEGMKRVDAELREINGRLIGATQVAPVAILWPIRSFQADATPWRAEPGGLRGDLVDLLYVCLSRQVGTHFIDEADLWDAECSEGSLRIGRASYTHVLVPSCTVLHERTVAKLKALAQGGVKVGLAGNAPALRQTESAVEPLDFSWCPRLDPADLPSLAVLEGEGREDIRCTSWRKDGQAFRLVINIGKTEWRGGLDGEDLSLPIGQVHVLQTTQRPAESRRPSAY